jgi:hypothetical protein
MMIELAVAVDSECLAAQRVERDRLLRDDWGEEHAHAAILTFRGVKSPFPEWSSWAIDLQWRHQNCHRESIALRVRAAFLPILTPRRRARGLPEVSCCDVQERTDAQRIRRHPVPRAWCGGVVRADAAAKN